MARILVVSGPSGSGKTTTMRKCLPNEIVGYTTRPPRTGETDGVDYHFITEDVYLQAEANGELAEKSTYYGNASYGITYEQIKTATDKGDCFVILDVNGMQQLKEIIPSVITVFFSVTPDTCEARMTKRGDPDGNIAKRLLTIDSELENFPLYDYVVDANQSPEDVQASINLILEVTK